MAQFLVDQGEATLDDFWLGCGYAGWGPGQLQNELERGNWLMVAADSSSIFDLLRKNDNNNDNNRPEKEEEEEADTITTTGIGVWEEMIRRIGKQDLLRHPLVKFEDTMLRKWVLRRLFFQTLPPSSTTRCTSLSTDRVNMENLLPGTVIRANTPILLQDQVFHESLVLILESGNGNNINNKQQGGMTIGVILNRPTSKTINLRGTDLPIRYGGRYGLKQYGKPELWLHAGGGNNNNNTSTTKLQEACVGSPIIGGDNTDDSTSCGSIMFWQCTREDAETAVDMGLANVIDFIVVSGVSLWHHPAATTASNNVVDLETYFGYTHHNKTNVLAAWNLLKKQKPLDLTTMVPNLEIANLAWVLSAGKNEEEDISSRVSVPAEFPEITNENDPEENVAKVALELWVKTFLMKQ